MRTRAHGLLAGATILAATAGVRAAAPPMAPTAPDAAEYAAAHAILTAKCVRCHGPEKQKSGLRLDTRAAVLEGGIDGPSILPGKSAESDLVRRILGQTKPRMPYKEPPLEAAEIAAIRAWIDAGAPGPAEATADAKADAKAGGKAEAKPGATTETPAPKHWAYVKPVRPELHAVQRKDWVKTPIDAFVLARLEHEGLEPSPEASRRPLRTRRP